MLTLIAQLALAQYNVLVTPPKRVISTDELSALVPCIESQWPGAETSKLNNIKCWWSKNDDHATVEVERDLVCYATVYNNPTAEEYIALEEAGSLVHPLDPANVDLETGQAVAILRRHGPEVQNPLAVACWDAVSQTVAGYAIEDMRALWLWYGRVRYWAKAWHVASKTALERMQCLANKTCSKLSD